ncbi:NADPH-flavin oxidoreductase [Methanocella sp. CWC-04]|uniref:NADPH-flavin oxidoreductase n=1 Tax=Methanooceanicella nereidis TaxID=2052831 RepID=A0AAP2RE25_9EURY|nr:flavin reductase family protein [Methanocella sp. CWC-04]MCD1294340.1 NADPH-flavin oxidoreductase [Methanocella sp. CWC-04]
MDKLAMGPRPYLFPMPTVLIGANVNEKPNYMAAAWASIANWVPPMVAVAVNHARYTNKGINENRTFSVNMPSRKQLAKTDYCGLVSGNMVDKSAIFESFYGKLETAPMASECPVSLECKLHTSLDLGSHFLFIGEIVDVYVDKDCITDGLPDIQKVDPVIYSMSQGNYWSVGENIGKAYSIGKEYKK